MFEKLVYFDKDDSAGDPPDDEHEEDVDESKVEKPKRQSFTPEQQAEIDKLIGATRVKEREKAKADFDARVQKEHEDAEKEAMKEQGKFKELADKAQTEKAAALADAEQARKEANDLKMQIAFEDAAEELDISFVSKQAAKDAFKFLDAEKVGEDGAGMPKALESLKDERPYLFADTSNEDTNTDAREKGKRPKKEVLDKERETELAQRFRIRKPR